APPRAVSGRSGFALYPPRPTMDLLLAICEGLGLAIAAGLILGVVFPPIMPTWGAVVGVAPIAVIGAGAALSGADEAVWPALPIGVVGGGLSVAVTRDVAAGATRRASGGTPDIAAQAPSGVMAIFVLAAVIVGVLSVLVPPTSLVAFAALLWIWGT